MDTNFFFQLVVHNIKERGYFEHCYLHHISTERTLSVALFILANVVFIQGWSMKIWTDLYKQGFKEPSPSASLTLANVIRNM